MAKKKTARPKQQRTRAEKQRDATTETQAIARSQRELAAAVGRSRSTIHAWVHDPRWPFGRRGPWAIADVQRWVEKTFTKTRTDVGYEDSDDRGDHPEDSVTYQTARTRKILEEERLLRLKIGLLEEELVIRQHFQQEARELLIRFRGMLLSVPRQAIDELEVLGLIEPDARHRTEQVLQRLVDNALEQLASGLNGLSTRRTTRTPVRI